MKPATRLPWLQDPTGDCGPEYVGPVDGPNFVTVAYKKKDAAFIVHACNHHQRIFKALIDLTARCGMVGDPLGSKEYIEAVDIIRQVGPRK